MKIKKTQLLRKISFSVLLLGSLTSLVVSTYAFTIASSLVRIEDFAFSTLEPAKLKLGLKNTEDGQINYYDNLTDEAFIENGQAKLTGAELAPMTSTFKEDWLVKDETNSYKNVTPKFQRSYASTSLVERPGYADSGFLQIELYLKESDTQSMPIKVFLSNKTTLTPDEEANEKIHAAYPDDTNLEELNNIVKTMRISVLSDDNYFIFDPYKDGDVILAGRLDLNDDGYYETYGSSYQDGSLVNHEALFGEIQNRDKIVYDEKLTQDFVPEGELDALNAKSKANTYPVNIEKSVENGVNFKVEDSISLQSFAYDSDSQLNGEDEKVLAYLTPYGEAKRIVVTYYIEGWDPQASNLNQLGHFLSHFCLTAEYDYRYISH